MKSTQSTPGAPNTSARCILSRIGIGAVAVLGACALLTGLGKTTGPAGGYLPVGFDKLSAFSATVVYSHADSNAPVLSGPRVTSQIPDAVRALEGKDVAIEGFMLPLKNRDGRVTEFLLLKNQLMCCFGIPPNLNEWVHVSMSGKGIKPCMDQPITIYGTLHVGEYQENRQMLGIYKLDGDGMRIHREF